MKASSANDNSQISHLSFSDGLHTDTFWSPRGEMFADDPRMKSIDDDLYEAEDLELEHLISQLTLCGPAPDASVDELQGFRKILLEGARAISMRFRFLNQLRSFALTDDLTGLYNRRGLLILGLQHLKLASRTGKSLLLFFVDIDQFKRVNDSLGHLKGDAFLICCSEVLRSTFRASDIIARIGGDEFVILAQEGADHGRGAIFERLELALRSLNDKVDSPLKLSLSVGAARFDPQNPISLGELLALADREMFEHKRARASSTITPRVHKNGDCIS
jgi:diguanylate cyclase (GGDEF)-like protein